MTRKLLLSILAASAAAFLPLAATSQIAPDRPPRVLQTEAAYKWEAFAGYGYTSLNQVNQSKNGLQGVNLALTRDWGKYFGLTADGGYYAYTYSATNPCPGTKTNCTPTVESVLFGPVLHANFYKNIDGFFHVLLGGEHSGGEQQTPKVSFAGGAGVGMDYKLNQRFALRLSGDAIVSSFSVIGNSSANNYSPHEHRNSRVALGVVYKF